MNKVLRGHTLPKGSEVGEEKGERRIDDKGAGLDKIKTCVNIDKKICVKRYKIFEIRKFLIKFILVLVIDI